MRGRTLQSPEPKRVLFYGACHATIFARVYETFCTDFSYSFDRITNYEIISQGIPFPYDRISEWDIVVFSPILNHAGYETARVIDVCIKNNVKYVCYPHLHWRGYFPYVEEGNFVDMPFWHYPASVALASTSDDFEAYVQNFNRPFKEDYHLFENLEFSTHKLQETEKLGECSFTISDFVKIEFRNKRLFLIPGHPTQTLYVETIRRLNEHLNLPLDPSYMYSASEPQDGVKLPIHPDVSERLGLRFQDADFQNNTSLFGSRTITWTDYLRLAYGFGKKSTMWKANAETAIKRILKPSEELSENDCVWASEVTILQAHAEQAPDPLFWKLNITWADPYLRHKLANWDNVYVYKRHWRETV